MDVETSEAIERVGARIDALALSLRGEIRAGDAPLRDEMATLREELRTEFREGLAENRRHTQILFESVRDDIRMVAEGVAALSARIETPPRSQTFVVQSFQLASWRDGELANSPTHQFSKSPTLSARR